MATSPREQREIVDVPTNVITGFLGAGKSTAILQLLRQKPADERWAVLVNEFGEVGIDGGLLSETGGEDQGVFIREVAGGCMCCASGIPMQIALTSLLSQARPHRLLIEPTGLGHPKEVLGLLAADHYRKALDLRATVTLVDARKVRDARYTEHPTFVQQLAVSDVIVANKADQYEDGDLAQLQAFLQDTDGLQQKPLHAVEHGALQADWLAPAAGEHDHHAHHHHDDSMVASQIPPAPAIPACGFLRRDNEGDGFYSQGWVFAPTWTFDEDKLYVLLSCIDAERVKAVFITNRGVSAFNVADGALKQSPLPDALDSRIEIISSDKDAMAGLEAKLMDCVASRPA